MSEEHVTAPTWATRSTQLPGIKAFIMIGVSFFLCLSCAGPRERRASGAARQPAEQREAPDTGTGVQYVEIKKAYAAMAQSDWESHKESLVGQKVHWIGWVSKVEGAGKNMWLKVDMNPPGNWDVTMQIEAQRVLSLRPERQVTFEGEIDDVRGTTEAGDPSIKVWLIGGSVVE